MKGSLFCVIKEKNAVTQNREEARKLFLKVGVKLIKLHVCARVRFLLHSHALISTFRTSALFILYLWDCRLVVKCRALCSTLVWLRDTWEIKARSTLFYSSFNRKTDSFL